MKKFNYLSVLTAVVLFVGMAFSSCDKSEPDPYEGKTNPSTIASANLVAYFPFDGTGVESIGNITPTVQPNVTYIKGRRGQAYQGGNGAYMLYTLPAASKMKTLKSFSVAMWFKSPLVTGDPEPIIFQIGKSDDLYWGNLTLALNRMSATADSLQFKAFFLKTGAEWSGQHVGFTKSSLKINKWMHLVFEYDATSSKYMIYKDGLKVVTSAGVEDRKAGSNGTALGDLVFANADKINIGSWRPKSENAATDAWMGWFLGNLDELRVFDKALTAAEAKALYDAEVTVMD